MNLLLDETRGIYIPQAFAQLYGELLNDDDKKILLDGPDNDDYWEVWEDVLNEEYKIDGENGTLYQDGDLWFIPEETMTEEQIIEEWKGFCLPYIIEAYEMDGFRDGPARRESFNNFVDSLNKDGRVSDKTANEICLPDYLDS